MPVMRLYTLTGLPVSQLRDVLYKEPAAVAKRLGLRLTPVESALLENVSDAQLRAMIDGIRVPDHRRRRFLQAVAATSAVAAVGCDEAEPIMLLDAGGNRPDVDAGLDAGPPMFDAGGNRPDVDAGPDASLPGDATVDATVDASLVEDASMSWGSRPDDDDG